MRSRIMTSIAFGFLAGTLAFSFCFAKGGGDKEGNRKDPTMFAPNGGDVLNSSNKSTFLDRARVSKRIPIDMETDGWYEALDFALSRHPGYAETVYFAGDHGVPMTLQRKIMTAFRSLRFYYVNEFVPTVDDRGDLEIKWRIGGQVKRLALHEGSSPIVLVNRANFEKLLRYGEADDVLAFFLHEALIRVYKDDSQITSARPLRDIGHIATIVAETFPLKASRRRALGADKVADMFCAAKIPVGVSAAEGVRLIEEMHRPDASYPDEVIAFTMDHERCETMRWQRVGPAKGTRTRFLREWKFIDHTDGFESKVRLSWETNTENYWDPSFTTLFYSNFRPTAITDFLVVPRTPMKILRIYTVPQAMPDPAQPGAWPGWQSQTPKAVSPGLVSPYFGSGFQLNR